MSSWTQLGLFIERNLPKKMMPSTKRLSKAKPIRKTTNGVKLAPGELDDPLDDIL
jgi:hypothetical protein